MFNDFEQKNRSRAIEVTNIAIDKIPRTHLFGFTNEKNLFIQHLHKCLLSRVKELNTFYKINRMEVGVLLDIHSWEYWVIDGSKPCEVLMRDNLEALQKMETARKYQLMFMHNHPSTGTFSGEDLKTFCNTESLYIMSVVGNDGSIYI